jgi:hypothetical protein
VLPRESNTSLDLIRLRCNNYIRPVQTARAGGCRVIGRQTSVVCIQGPEVGNGVVGPTQSISFAHYENL